MRMRSLAALLFVFSVSAFAQTNVRQQLLDADRAFNRETQSHRLEGWMSYMADNVVLDRGKPVVGKDAVRAELTPEWSDPNFRLTWDPDEAHAMPGGKKGFTHGRWELTMLGKDGKPVKLTGEYLTVWQLDPQGHWRVIWDGGAANPPGNPPAPEN